MPVLLLIIWPIAEIAAAVAVAQAVGVPLTILLLVAGWPLGLWLMRVQGRTAWRRLSAAVAVGRPPGREVLDGALIMVGGGLLVLPGFITDVAGAALLLPPVRSLAHGTLLRNLQSRLLRTLTGFSRPSAPDYDVDATATDITSPPRRLRR